MPLQISLSANHKNLDKIVEKAKALKAKIHDEISWDDGYKYSDKSSRNIKVFTHSEALWNYIVELEPTVEVSPKMKRAKGAGLLSEVSSEEILDLGYPEPTGKK